MSGSRNEDLQREALAQIDRLLDKSRAERTAALHALAHSRPDLHLLVMEMLEHEECVGQGFMEPGGAPSSGVLRPDARLGPYRIIRLLGEGGMGEVWLAIRDDGLYEGQVAIKTLHPYFAGGALRERFLREAKVLGRLAHSNIARLLDAGIHDGVVYLVLEYVVGRPIDVACDEEKLDVAARLVIFRRLCDAVAHAHASLVVHRDIKPGNVLLTADGAPKLLDFGIASFYEPDKSGAQSDITRLTGRIFTPEYAAPEQVLGQEITTATDVYSLGVLLHALLTGEHPYEPPDAARSQWEHAVLHREPQRLARAIEERGEDKAAKRSTPLPKLRRELSGDLENIVQKALRKRPQERYPTVAAFADDIRRYLEGEPVLARADSAWYRLRKFSRRNRLAVASAAAVVVALGAGLAAALWQLQVARAERQRAEEVKDFVASIFRSADPFFTGKTSMTAAELLTLARERIDRELVAQPRNAIELLHIVGESQGNLEQYEAAKATFEKAIELAEQQQPRDEVSIAEAMSWLGTIARNEGKLEEVRSTLEKALPVLRANQPRTGKSLAGALMELAYLQVEAGDLDAAFPLAREAVAAVENALGSADTETILMKRHEALILVLAKRFDEALPRVEQTLRDVDSVPDPAQRRVLRFTTESLYGRLLLDSGADVGESVRHLETAIALGTDLYGPTGDALLPVLSLLTKAQSRQGDVKGATMTARRAYETTKGGLLSARAMNNLGRYTYMAGQVEASIEPLRRAIELGREHDTGKGTWMFLAQGDYASALALTGRFAEAEKVLSEAVPAAKASGMPGNTSVMLDALGLTRQLQSRWAESERAYREALEHTSKTDLSQLVRSEALLGIGVARLEQGHAAEAEDWIRQADEALRITFLNPIPLSAKISQQLGCALLAQGKTDAAREAFGFADKYWRGYEPTHRGAGEAAYWLARGHMAAGDKTAAREALLRAVEILKASSLRADVRRAKDAQTMVAKL